MGLQTGEGRHAKAATAVDQMHPSTSSYWGLVGNKENICIYIYMPIYISI